MKKKTPTPRLRLHLSPLVKGIGGGIRDILVSAATHPTTAGLAVMTLTSTISILSGAYKEETDGQRRLKGELTGMYNGAQAVAVASAVVPVAVGAISIVKEAIASKAGAGEGGMPG